MLAAASVAAIFDSLICFFVQSKKHDEDLPIQTGIIQKLLIKELEDKRPRNSWVIGFSVTTFNALDSFKATLKFMLLTRYGIDWLVICENRMEQVCRSSQDWKSSSKKLILSNEMSKFLKRNFSSFLFGSVKKLLNITSPVLVLIVKPITNNKLQYFFIDAIIWSESWRWLVLL